MSNKVFNCCKIVYNCAYTYNPLIDKYCNTVKPRHCRHLKTIGFICYSEVKTYKFIGVGDSANQRVKYERRLQSTAKKEKYTNSVISQVFDRIFNSYYDEQFVSVILNFIYIRNIFSFFFF